jgi:hypothetical protein
LPARRYKSQGCGVTVHAQIGRASLNGPLSDCLSVSLIDDSSFEEIRQAAARFANQATRGTASKSVCPSCKTGRREKHEPSAV